MRKLGQGFASHVYEAIHLRSSKHVAVKIYNKSNLTPLNVRQVEREIDIHSRLHHPNVLDLVRSHRVTLLNHTYMKK